MDSYRFIHDFAPGAIHFGRGVVDHLDCGLSEHGCERVLVVTGRNVAANSDVREPLIDGLNAKIASFFDETSPEKRIETAYDGVQLMNELDIDALVGVGGGSSLDIATVMRLLHADYRSLCDVQREVDETGSITLRSSHNSLVPLFVVPTTFAGADLSTGAGINVPLDDTHVTSAAVIEKPLVPDMLVYDPDFYDSTPFSALAGSAMNGFNKGIEALYSRYATPVTDGTASHGLKYLCAALPELRDADSKTVLEDVVTGMILVQYGVSVPERMKLAILHAFGHAFRDHGIKQGLGHSVVTPEVLRFVFDRVDGRRDLIASSLTIDSSRDRLPELIVDKVASIRDSLDLPSRIQDLDGISKGDLESIAARTHRDHCLSNSPAGLDPSIDDLEMILKKAW